MNKITLVHDDNRIYTTQGGGSELAPADMPDYFSQLVLNLKTHTIMWVQDLDLYGKDFLRVLRHIDYKDQTEQNPAVKDMSRHGYKYIVSDKSVFYYIIIRTNKKTLYIYNVNNLLSNISPVEIFKAWGRGSYSLSAFASAVSDGIESMNGWQAKKTPFTSSMVASRAWREIEGLYKCPNLIDCNLYPSPVEKATLAAYLRKSYQAGWNYLNQNVSRETYKNQPVNVYDVNSLYPFIAATRPLPWGAPAFFKNGIPEEIKKSREGEYYYFIRVKMSFDIKPGHFPFLQKRGDFTYRITDYMTTSDMTIINKKTGEEYKMKAMPEFILSQTDWEMVQRHYDIHNYEIIDGVVFRTCRCIFKDFVNHYYTIKQQASESGDTGTKRVAKMIINGAIGGLAKRPTRINTIFGEDGAEHFVKSVNPSACNIHIASAILAYAREYTYEAAYANRESFIYSDTDSIHLYGNQPARNIKIDSNKLGAWKLEKQADDAYYMKRKSYIIHNGDGYRVTMAGVEFGSQNLINDILSGVENYKIQEKANKGDYGNGFKKIFNEVQQGKHISYHGRDYEIYDMSYDMELLKEMREEFNNTSDRIRGLNYCAYPTMVTTCHNFIISYSIQWMCQNDREDRHIRQRMI